MSRQFFCAERLCTSQTSVKNSKNFVKIRGESVRILTYKGGLISLYCYKPRIFWLECNPSPHSPYLFHCISHRN